MAFGRIINLKIGPQPTSGETSTTGLLISDLNIAFEITRSITISDNECKISIYNAKEDTINNILKQGNNIRLEAGYEDEGTGVVYTGNILEADTTFNGRDRITNVTGGGIQKSQDALGYLTVSLSYSKDTVLSLPIQDIASVLNLTPFGVDAASNVTAPNGFSYTGTAKGALYQLKKLLKSAGLGLYVDNDLLIVYRIGVQDTRFKFAYLTPISGLINAYYKDEEYRVGDEVEYKRRVEYKCVLNPNLAPNGLVTIKGKAVDGTFINEKVSFKGDNFGGEFTSKGLALV